MITHAQAKLIRSLRSRKRRDQGGSFLAEGVRLVEELLASGWPIDLIVTAPALAGTERGRELRDRVAAGDWAWEEISEAELTKLADTGTPQGVVAVARCPRRSLAGFEPPERAAVVIFDRVADPGNMGTLLRTAEALGIAWAVALPGTVDLWSPKVVRASAGSIFYLPVSGETWDETLAWLRQWDFAILCADPGGEPLERGARTAKRFALVLGNEPSGLSGSVLADCDSRVAVELRGRMDSLNVAVAGALLLDRLLAGTRSNG